MGERGDPARDPDAPPPFLGTWGNVYALVLGELALIVLLFRILRSFAS
jgi:hypothetical protein